MADLCVMYTYSSVKINDTTAGANRLITSSDKGSITGLDGAPVRSQVDMLAQTDGGDVHTKFYAPRIITFQGEVQIQTAAPEDQTAWLTAMNTLEAAVVAALQAQLNSATTLSWTPTGLAGRSLSATYGVPGQEIQFSGPPLVGQRTFSFSLIAASPTIS